MRIDKSKLVIRKATMQDIDATKFIAREVGRKNYAPFLGEANIANYIESGMLDKDIEDHYKNTVVCLHETEIIGVCAYFDDLLHLLIVKHKYQGNGAGKVILDFAEDQLFKCNTVINLETFENNTPTIAFYKKNGWKIVSKEFSDYTNGYYLKFEKTSR